MDFKLLILLSISFDSHLEGSIQNHDIFKELKKIKKGKNIGEVEGTGRDLFQEESNIANQKWKNNIKGEWRFNCRGNRRYWQSKVEMLPLKISGSECFFCPIGYSNPMKRIKNIQETKKVLPPSSFSKLPGKKMEWKLWSKLFKKPLSSTINAEKRYKGEFDKLQHAYFSTLTSVLQPSNQIPYYLMDEDEEVISLLPSTIPKAVEDFYIENLTKYGSLPNSDTDNFVSRMITLNVTTVQPVTEKESLQIENNAKEEGVRGMTSSKTSILSTCSSNTNKKVPFMRTNSTPGEDNLMKIVSTGSNIKDIDFMNLMITYLSPALNKLDLKNDSVNSKCLFSSVPYLPSKTLGSECPIQQTTTSPPYNKITNQNILTHLLKEYCEGSIMTTQPFYINNNTKSPLIQSESNIHENSTAIKLQQIEKNVAFNNVLFSSKSPYLKSILFHNEPTSITHYADSIKEQWIRLMINEIKNYEPDESHTKSFSECQNSECSVENNFCDDVCDSSKHPNKTDSVMPNYINLNTIYNNKEALHKLKEYILSLVMLTCKNEFPLIIENSFKEIINANSIYSDSMKWKDDISSCKSVNKVENRTLEFKGSNITYNLRSSPKSIESAVEMDVEFETQSPYIGKTPNFSTTMPSMLDYEFELSSFQKSIYNMLGITALAEPTEFFQSCAPIQISKTKEKVETSTLEAYPIMNKIRKCAITTTCPIPSTPKEHLVQSFDKSIKKLALALSRFGSDVDMLKHTPPIEVIPQGELEENYKKNIFITKAKKEIRKKLRKLKRQNLKKSHLLKKRKNFETFDSKVKGNQTLQNDLIEKIKQNLFKVFTSSDYPLATSKEYNNGRFPIEPVLSESIKILDQKVKSIKEQISKNKLEIGSLLREIDLAKANRRKNFQNESEEIEPKYADNMSLVLPNYHTHHFSFTTNRTINYPSSIKNLEDSVKSNLKELNIIKEKLLHGLRMRE